MKASTSTPNSFIEPMLRIGLLLFILYWCFLILEPFIMPVVWGIIIAVVLYPLHAFLSSKMGGKRVLPAILIILLLLMIIFLPVSIFISTMTESILELKRQIEIGEWTIPVPSEEIKSWPIIGEKLYAFLIQLYEHTGDTLAQYETELTEMGKKLLSAIIGTGLGILQLMLSVIIAGALIATKGTEAAATKIMCKLVDEEKGEEFVKLMVTTIRKVLKGVLGVAVIQTILAGFGIFLSGIPHAGVWILICLILSIIQIGPGLVIIPSVIYLFMHNSTLSAILWSVFFGFVLISDNILKPILLGKGAPVPMLVIFLGVIGGFIMSGFIGLFTGAIVLSIGYKLLISWMGIAESSEQSPAN